MSKKVGGTSSPVVLQTVAQTSLFVIKLLGLWLFIRGHNEPGGGFIAGLVIASAVALQGLAFGQKAAESVFPFKFHALLGTGLGLSALTVVVPAVFGYPVLKTWFDYLPIPHLLGGEIELASAVIFDLGVFLVVVGAVKGILVYISEEKLGDQDRPGEAERGYKRSV